MKLLATTFLATAAAAPIFSTTSSSTLRTQSRAFLADHINALITSRSGGLRRNLQSYTPEQCSTLLTSMSSYDTDGSGGLNQEEYYAFLTALDAELGGSQTKDSESYAELPLILKVSHKSLACYCTVLGGGEDCCVGAEAEVPLDVLTDEAKVGSGEAEEYANEVCETVYWTMGGLEGEGGETVTATTEAAETTEAVETTEAAETTTETETTESSLVTVAPEGTTVAASDDVTTEAASDDITETETTPSAGELPVTTEAPLVSDDGTMTFITVTTTIDFSSYGSAQPTSYDPATYYDATEVLENTDDNGILEDMQKGFVGLALDVYDGIINAESESDDVTVEGGNETNATTTVATEAAVTTPAVEGKLRMLNTIKIMDTARQVNDITFLIGGNLTTEVEDVPCPAGLAYAPEGAPCLSFAFSVSPPADSYNATSDLNEFATTMDSAIDNGDLYAKVTTINPNTYVTGSGEPGAGEFDATTTTVEGAESEDQRDGEGGLSTGAIIGIVVAVLAVPLAWLAYKSMNKDDESTVPSAKPVTPSVPAAAPNSDDEVAGTAQRTATAVALKPDATTKLGFTYKMYPDRIVVATVKEGSIFDGTPLKEGNELISINGQDVKGMDRDAFRGLLTQLPEGNVTIVMNEIVPLTHIRVMANKPEPTSKLGFTYKFVGSKIVVASVKDDGIFSDTELKKGQEIFSINSRRVEGMNKDQFRGLLQNLPQGKVYINVKDIVEFSIMKIETNKPSPDSKLGFMYKVLDDGIVVASVNDSGIFANTALSKGQEIVSINGKNVQKMNKEAFRGYLSTIPAGVVTFIVVDKPKKWSKSGTTLVCKAVKETDDTKLGFTYKVMKDGATIESVGEYGIFAPTDLAPGQEIISVNNIPVAGKDRMEFRELLTSLTAGEVTIVVVDRSPKYETKGEVVVVEANKETDTTKLGFTYKVLKNKVTVESVKPESIFGETELAKGQEILSINGTPVRGMSRDQFRELLTGLSSGTVRLIVSDPFKATVSKGGVRSITAEKETDDTKLGFTYKVLRDVITVETVKDEGIFGQAGLKPGQQILRINGTAVKGMDRNGFRDLLGKLTAGEVTIDVFDESLKAYDAATPKEEIAIAPKIEEKIIVEPEEPATREVNVEETVAEDSGAPEVESGLTPEEEAHLEEVKAEVRTLVEKATPGKSADDMLAQYEGREDELLSHLKKFVERSGKQ